MARKYKHHADKMLAILDIVDDREVYHKTTSIYAIAKALGYKPNGAFSNSVWLVVDKGLLDARPAGTRGGRFSWQLSVTTKGWAALINAGYRVLA